MNGELYPGEFEAMERQGRLDAVIPEQKMMKSEEAIKWLIPVQYNTGITELSQAVGVAIDALHQRETLDIIRAEIAEALTYHGSDEDYDEGFDCATRRALQIIDKYKSKSEGQE